MSDAIALLLALIGGWTLGHAPALFARYVWKKAPLSLAAAIVIASVVCVSLPLAVVALHETYGVPEHARTWASWIGVSSLASIRTMARGKREQLISKLKAMIADPATTDEARALAAGRLRQLKEVAVNRAPQVAYAGRLPLTDLTAEEPDHATDVASLSQSRARSFQYQRWVIYAVGVALAINLALVASGYRVLIHEKVMPPSKLEVPDGWTISPMIDCSYWTGRSVKVASHAYGTVPGAIDECPFVRKDMTTRQTH